jgi:hypothetical protein
MSVSFHQCSMPINFSIGDAISLICDKSVTAQNLAFLSYWYRKKRLQMHF